MNDEVADVKFAFNILLARALNQSLHLIPDDAPYNIAHFFTNCPTGLHASMRDGRTMNLTYETRPDVNNDCFYVNVYFESPLYVNPIMKVTMSTQMLTAYKRFVEVFIEKSMRQQGSAHTPNPTTPLPHY